MADIVVTAGLSDADYRRGLMRMEAETAGATGRIAEHTAHIGHRMLHLFHMDLGIRSMRHLLSELGEGFKELAKENEHAAAVLEGYGEVMKQTKMYAAELADGLLDAVGIGGFFGDIGQDMIDAKKLDEKTKKMKEFWEWVQKSKAENKRTISSMGEDQFENRFDLEAQKFDENLTELYKKRGQFKEGSNERAAIKEAMDDEYRRHDAAILQIKREKAEKLDAEEAEKRKIEETERERHEKAARAAADDAARFEFRLRESAIDRQKLMGMEREAEYAKLRLDLEKDLHEVQTAEALTDAQKRSRAEALKANFDADMEALARKKPDRVQTEGRRLGGGQWLSLHDAALRTQVFGIRGGGVAAGVKTATETAQQKQVDEQKKTNAILERIRDTIGGGSAYA